MHVIWEHCIIFNYEKINSMYVCRYMVVVAQSYQPQPCRSSSSIFLLLLHFSSFSLGFFQTLKKALDFFTSSNPTLTRFGILLGTIMYLHETQSHVLCVCKFIIDLLVLFIDSTLCFQLLQVLPDLHVPSLGSVLAQGMNLKKKHEVGIQFLWKQFHLFYLLN